MLLLEEIQLPNGKKGLSINSEDQAHWLNFLTSIKENDAKWLEDALSLRRALEDIEKNCLISHEDIESRFKNYEFKK